MNFDVESFYPSITKNLFHEAINFAKDIVDISNTDFPIAMHTRKTIVFNDDIPWVRRSENKELHLSIGLYNDAEV